MKPQLLRGKIVLKRSKIHGYGVFAEQDFKKGSVIEECHTLNIKEPSACLANYHFRNPFNEQSLLPLGYGALYNHHRDPNAEFLYDGEDACLSFVALRPISKGEEITVKYSDTWFSSRQMKEIVLKPFRLKRLLFLILRGGLVITSVYILINVLNKA